MQTERKKKRKHGRRKKYIRQYKYNYKCCNHCEYKTRDKKPMDNHFYLRKCPSLFNNNRQIRVQSRKENNKERRIIQSKLYLKYCHHCEYKTPNRITLENHFRLHKCLKLFNNRQTIRDSKKKQNLVNTKVIVQANANLRANVSTAGNVTRRVNPIRKARSTANLKSNVSTRNCAKNGSKNISTLKTILKNEIKLDLDQFTAKIKTKLVESWAEMKRNTILQENLNQCMKQDICASIESTYIQHYMCAICLTKCDCEKSLEHHLSWCVKLKTQPLNLPKTCWNLDQFSPTHCFICQIEIKHGDEYILHMQIHQTSLIYMSEIAEHADHPVKKKFNCILCDYCTMFSSNLTHHVFKAHREQMLFRSDYCPFACMNLEILNLHMQYIHRYSYSTTIIYQPVFML